MSQTQWEAVLVSPVDETRDHVHGPAEAPVTLVQYGDYECPYCGEAYPIIKDIQTQMGGRLRSFRRVLGVRVRGRDGEVAEHEPQPIPQPGLHVLDDRVSLAAVRAFVVAVLNQRDSR